VIGKGIWAGVIVAMTAGCAADQLARALWSVVRLAEAVTAVPSRALSIAKLRGERKQWSASKKATLAELCPARSRDRACSFDILPHYRIVELIG